MPYLNRSRHQWAFEYSGKQPDLRGISAEDAVTVPAVFSCRRGSSISPQSLPAAAADAVCPAAVGRVGLTGVAGSWRSLSGCDVEWMAIY